MDAQCEAHQKKIEDTNKTVKEIRKILVGNGEVGLCEQVRNHESFIEKFKKRRYDLTTTVYRLILGIIIAYIAVQVGLK